MLFIGLKKEYSNIEQELEMEQEMAIQTSSDNTRN